MERLERLFWRDLLAWWPGNLDGLKDSDGAGLKGHSAEAIMYRQYDTGGVRYLTEKHTHLPDL